MAAGFEQALADALREFQTALEKGLAAGIQELARQLAKDPDFERSREPKVIDVMVRRDQIANGAASLYRGWFVEAGQRAAFDARRGNQAADVAFDDTTTQAEKLRFVVVYRAAEGGSYSNSRGDYRTRCCPMWLPRADV